MVTSLGHGPNPAIDAAARAGRAISFIYNQQFTSPAQEALAEELTRARAAPASTACTSSPAARRRTRRRCGWRARYHVERGEPGRTRIVSPAQAYHGPTMATLGLTGRAGAAPPVRRPFIAPQLHIPPSTLALRPVRPGGARRARPRAREAGPAPSPPSSPSRSAPPRCRRIRRPTRSGAASTSAAREHGFLICLDEVVTGLGRTGHVVRRRAAADRRRTSSRPPRGSAPATRRSARCCAAITSTPPVERGSRAFEHGHTWDGAPLPCAVGRVRARPARSERGLVERVRERGPALRDELAAALEGSEMVREVRGRGFLLGVDYVDPRDGETLPARGARRSRAGSTRGARRTG